jgi:hypothetical protein
VTAGSVSEQAERAGFILQVERRLGGYLAYCYGDSEQYPEPGTAFDFDVQTAGWRALGEAIERNVVLSVGRAEGWDPVELARRGSLGSAFAFDEVSARTRALAELRARGVRAHIWAQRRRAVDITESVPVIAEIGAKLQRRCVVLTRDEDPHWVALVSSRLNGRERCLFSDGSGADRHAALSNALREHLMLAAGWESHIWSCRSSTGTRVSWLNCSAPRNQSFPRTRFELRR